MSLNAATSSKIGNWFKNKIQPGDQSRTFDEDGSGLLSQATKTTAPVATGLLSTAADTAPAAQPAMAKAALPPLPATTTSAAETPAPIVAKSGEADVVTAPGTSQQAYDMSAQDNNKPAAATNDVVPATVPAPTPAATGSIPAGTTTDAKGVTTLNLDDLTQRTVSPNETVEGHIKGLLADNSDYIQGFRDRSKREANARGLLNSTMAITGGEEAAAAGALPIATADAGAYGKAADYNAALLNQGRMANMDAYNKMSLQDLQLATERIISQNSLNASMASASASRAAAQYSADVSANASRYASDNAARTAADNNAARTRDAALQQAADLERQNAANHAQIVAGIVGNNEMPPETRARLLESLGEHGLAASMYLLLPTDPPPTTTTPDSTNTGGGGGE